MAVEVFISHAHEDRKLAAWLVQFLVMGVGVEVKEIRCTSLKATGLVVGEVFAEKLRRDLKACRIVMPLVTSHSIISEFVTFEIGAAWVLEKSIKPVVYANNAPLRVPALLAGLVFADLKDRDTLIDLADGVAREIYFARDRPSPAQMSAAADAFLAVLCKLSA